MQVCFAVPLRKQTVRLARVVGVFVPCCAVPCILFSSQRQSLQIVVEQLSFPSGTATAQMIAALHKTKLTRAISGTAEEVPPPHESEGTESWELKWKVLTWTFIASAVLTLLSHFFPVRQSRVSSTLWCFLALTRRVRGYVHLRFSERYPS